MLIQSRPLLVAVAAAGILGAAIAINPAQAVAAPQECLAPAPGVHQCTSPGHAEIHVPVDRLSA